MPKKKFFIPQITVEETNEPVEETVPEETVPEKPKYEPEGFVSSIYGKHVKDNAYFHGVKYGNNARQYDIFRDPDKRVDNDDFKDYIIPKDFNPYEDNNDNQNENQNENEFYQNPNNQNEVNNQNEFYYNVPTPDMNEGNPNFNNGNPNYNNMNNMNPNMNNPYYNNQPNYNNYNNNPGFNNQYQNPGYNPGYNQGYPNPNPYYNQNPNQNYNQGYPNQNPNPYYNNQPNYNDPRMNQNPYQNNYQNNYPNMNQNYNNFNNENNYNNDTNNEQEEFDPNKNYNTLEFPKEEVVEKPAKVDDNPIISSKNNQEVKFRQKRKRKYVAPPLNVLRIKPKDQKEDFSGTTTQRDIINNTLTQFDIGGHVVNFTKGPTVTQFEVQLDPGVKLQKINSIQINLQANLRATSIRMEIPIPGKTTVGIEVPNQERSMVFFGDMISDKKFLNDGNPMNVVLGVNIQGEPVYLDIAKMPHGIIAGSTGSGKSVCINAIIASILYKAHPDDVKLVLIDPKRVEFSRYAGIPHLATPIITEPKMAVAALKWVVDEMEDRYRLFETCGVTQYKEYIQEEKTDARLKHIPYIVVIADEYNDLSTNAGPELEEAVLKITQKARAAGIHLIVATQRPSVDCINGTIKTNLPTKIAFKVTKALESNIILDHAGAEKLLGNGDMLYTDQMGVENRIQGAFISSSEIKDVVNALEDYQDGEYLFTEEELKKKTMVDHSDDALSDDLFKDIARFVVENNTASINYLQKKFSCGFSRIQAIIMKLGELGVVSENLGSRAREVLVNSAELEDILENL